MPIRMEAVMHAVRVFISSTFNDFVDERNILHERVFPRLEALCQGHGCSFQAVDLRWGISERDGEDYGTLDICLAEVRRCQHLTVLMVCVIPADFDPPRRTKNTRFPACLAEEFCKPGDRILVPHTLRAGGI